MQTSQYQSAYYGKELDGHKQKYLCSKISSISLSKGDLAKKAESLESSTNELTSKLIFITVNDVMIVKSQHPRCSTENDDM